MARIKTALEQSSHDFLWQITDSPQKMKEGIFDASRNGVRCVLLMGGDGTVHEALSSIEQTSLPFGLLPCGRGNDFARNIGISLNLTKNCIIPAEPLFFRLDLPSINGNFFGSIACMGFDAEVNKFAMEKKGYFGGTLGYIICVLRALKTFKPFEVEIRIDDFRWGGQVMMVAISNGPYYGGGMKIAPHASMNDGLFDVCVIQEVSKGKLLREFPKVFRGTHIPHPKVLMKRGKRVEVNGDQHREIFADGEQAGTIPCVAEIGGQQIYVMRNSPSEEFLSEPENSSTHQKGYIQ